MMTRCPGCGKPVAEADDICPHCGRDFSAPIARKPATKPPEEAPAKEPAAAAPEPAKAVERHPALEEVPPAEPETVLTTQAPDEPPAKAPVIDTPPAYEPPKGYAPGAYDPGSDPYAFKKEEARPPWHWLGLAVLCAAGYMGYGLMSPPPPPPPPAPVQVAQAPAPPAPAPAAVLQPLADAKDAAAAQAAAMAAALDVPPKEPRPVARRPRRPARPAPVEEQPEPVEDAIIIAEAEAEPRRQRRSGPVTEWRMRGKLFDLLSAEPVAGADVVFMDASTGRRFATGSDAQGLYRATLPVNETGYDLAIRHSKYEPKYFEDGSPPYRKLGLEQRQSAVDDLLRVLQNKDLIKAEGGTVLERDFVLIPLSR
ncbi:MAG: hypothetical protein HYZ75_06405 [Elusimicrobia bacterium]|nr:hypothetical protein [Elusimicrobiota bacterium]